MSEKPRRPGIRATRHRPGETGYVARRCSSCEKMSNPDTLTQRYSKAHGVLFLCAECERDADARGALEL